MCAWDGDACNDKSGKSLCVGKQKKRCKKKGSCDWDGEVCNDKTIDVSSINEKAGGAEESLTKILHIHPNSGCIVTKISTLLECVFMVMWYQLN